MGYQEHDIRSKPNRYFRTSMDIGMGIFYTAIGAVIVYSRAFGNMTVPPALAYILGGMLVIGGLFRFIKGVKAALPGKKDSNSSGQ